MHFNAKEKIPYAKIIAKPIEDKRMAPVVVQTDRKWRLPRMIIGIPVFVMRLTVMLTKKVLSIKLASIA